MESDSDIDDSSRQRREKMDFDALLHRVGSYGRYQRMVVPVILLSGVSSLFHFMSIQFFMARPYNFWCEVNSSYMENGTNFCKDSTSPDCPSFYFHKGPEMGKTVISDFKLFCFPLYFDAILEAAYFASTGLGVTIMGMLADRFGRRRCLLFCGICEIISGYGVALSQNWQIFVVSRCINGFFTLPFYDLGIILALEIIGRDHRSLTMTLSSIYCDVVKALTGLLGLYFDNWRWYYAAGTSIAVPILISVAVIIPESPRWLYKTGHTAKARIIMKKIARVNSKPLPTNIEVITHIQPHGKPSDLLARGVWLTTILLCYSWGVTAMAFFGIYLNTDFYIVGKIKPQIVLIAYACVNIVTADIMTSALYNYYGRRVTHMLSTLVTSMSLFLSAVLPGLTRFLSGALGLIAATIAFNGLYIRTGELYPTQIRSLGLGVCSLFGRIGSVIMPFVKLQDDHAIWIPNVTYGALLGLAAVIALYLVETKNCPLPDDIKVEHTHSVAGTEYRPLLTDE